MAEAVIRIFKNIKALKRSQVTQVPNPLGVTPSNCIDNITSNENMERFSKSFVDTMPQWLKEQFFDPKMVKQRLNTHEYQQIRKCTATQMFKKFVPGRI